MTENVTQKKKVSVSRAEFEELSAEVRELKQTLVAVRTQMQQILSAVFPPVVEKEARQKFR